MVIYFLFWGYACLTIVATGYKKSFINFANSWNDYTHLDKNNIDKLEKLFYLKNQDLKNQVKNQTVANILQENAFFHQ